MTPSLRSGILAWLLKAVNFKKQVERRARRPLARSGKGFVPRHIQRNYSVHIRIFNGRSIATFESKEKVSDTHLIFFHGGAYIFEAASAHRKLAREKTGYWRDLRFYKDMRIFQYLQQRGQANQEEPGKNGPPLQSVARAMDCAAVGLN